MTGPRVAVLSFLASTDSHPTAEEVETAVNAEGQVLSRASVYNVLHSLTRSGLVADMTSKDGPARYDAHKEDKTAPYAGIPELLDTLRANGIQCAVFSNKADAFCGKIIDHYFGTGRFDAVRGSRPGVPTKPDPAGL